MIFLVYEPLLYPLVIPSDSTTPRYSLTFSLADEFAQTILTLQLFKEHASLVQLLYLRHHILLVAVNEAESGCHVKKETVADNFGSLIVLIIPENSFVTFRVGAF